MEFLGSNQNPAFHENNTGKATRNVISCGDVPASKSFMFLSPPPSAVKRSEKPTGRKIRKIKRKEGKVYNWGWGRHRKQNIKRDINNQKCFFCPFCFFCAQSRHFISPCRNSPRAHQTTLRVKSFAPILQANRGENSCGSENMKVNPRKKKKI